MSVFVFAIEEGFDLSGLPQDYKEKVTVSESKRQEIFGLEVARMFRETCTVQLPSLFSLQVQVASQLLTLEMTKQD